VKSNTNGILVEKNVNQGDYVNQGTIMFKVANLSQVWALFDAYEGDLPFLMVGSQLSFTLKSLPGKIFSGKISFIDPIVDKNTRTAKVRVVIPNPGLVLKPEMYATATVNASLKQYEAKIIVPKSAILWTGKRSIVYVKQQGVSSPVFSLREIELGPSLGEAFVVLSGLSEGDEIVTNGVFTIDASAQLEGKQSMMNHPSAASSHGDGPSESKGAQIRVQGICEMCKENIETAAKGVKGVAFAQWDKNKKILQLRYNTSMASLDNIGHAIAEAGYDNETRKAPLAAYEALAPCCKYRK
jgi:Cu(I)/Ag(I) efflux system membrane fusion protein